MTIDESIYIAIKDGKAELTEIAKKLINVGIGTIGCVGYFFEEKKPDITTGIYVDEHGKLKASNDKKSD
jgi:hypothetical protein